MKDETERRCDAVIYKRDQLRIFRGGRRKFRMHYTKEHCSRRATHGALCRQHSEMPGISVWTKEFER